MGFTKLSSSLIASSVWNEPDKTRIVWITMLAMADQNGDVKAAIPGLAHLARETVQDTLTALAVLSAPDPHSGRKEMDGRRVIEIEGGWHLVTHPFYREQGMSEEARKYWREKKRAYRLSNVQDKKRQSRQSKMSCSDLGTVSVLKRKRIVKEKPSRLQCEEYAQEIGQPRSDGTGMFLHWEEKGWPKSWRLTMQKWKAFNYLPSQRSKPNGQYSKRPSRQTEAERWYEEKQRKSVG